MKWVDYVSELVDQGLEPNFSDLLKFVDGRATVMSTEYAQVASEAGRQNRLPEQAHMISAISSHSRAVCKLCWSEHRLPACPRLVGMDIQARWKFIKSKGLCFSCL